MNNFGYLYETNGFPPSNRGDVLGGVGIVTSASPSISCDLGVSELTWSIDSLVSLGQLSPDMGRTVIVSYAKGVIRLYCDPSNNHYYGVDPPNATVPSTFIDGDRILIGHFTQFVMFYDTYFQIGSFQGLVNFTSGRNLFDLQNPNGVIFAGTIGPGLDPSIPRNYSLKSVGRIVAPSLCTVQGNVSFVYNPADCFKCEGITRLVLGYNGSEDISQASVSCGALLEVQGNQLIITPDMAATCDGDDHNDHYRLPKEITVSVGSDEESIHTSCSRPIDPGNEIGNFAVSAVDKIIVPCDEGELCEGITRLSLLYSGIEDPNSVTVSDGAYASVSGDTITLFPTDSKLRANTTILVGTDEAIIHTSCSQPLEVGFIYGEFEVVAIDKILPSDPGGNGLPTTGPVVGVTLDLVDGEGNIFSTLTDENGDYAFYDVAAGTIMVNVVVPLGYVPLTPTDSTLVCSAGEVAVVDFVFERLATQDKPRSVGFWKHQVNSALKGKEKGVKVTASELLALFDELHYRFDQYFDIFIPVQTLQEFSEALSPKKKASMYEKARSQFAAMLLNVVSNRLSTWQFVSEDNATVSQAITFISDLLTDTDSSNDELAKKIAEKINKREELAAGVIPLTIGQIAYTPPAEDTGRNSAGAAAMILKVGNYPNPFNPATTIRYELRGELEVRLSVYNILGQKVRDLVRGDIQRGEYEVVWDGRDDSGKEVASGVYFYRLQAGEHVVTRRMILIH